MIPAPVLFSVCLPSHCCSDPGSRPTTVMSCKDHAQKPVFLQHIHQVCRWLKTRSVKAVSCPCPLSLRPAGPGLLTDRSVMDDDGLQLLVGQHERRQLVRRDPPLQQLLVPRACVHQSAGRAGRGFRVIDTHRSLL